MVKREPLQQSQHLNLVQKLSEDTGDKGSKPRPPKTQHPFSNISNLFLSPKVSLALTTNQCFKQKRTGRYDEPNIDLEELVDFDSYLKLDSESLRVKKPD